VVAVKTKNRNQSAVLNEPVYIKHKALIEQSKKGDRKAQFALYHQYVDAMFQISLRMLNNQVDAEDVLQESFVKAFKNLKQFKYESSFGAWLKKIVINSCITYLNKRKLKWITVEEARIENAPVNNEVDEIQLNQLPKIQKIKERIKELPDGFRVVLSLYLLEGYDHKEISQILNISESTSKTQYHRAKNKLKQLVKMEYNG